MTRPTARVLALLEILQRGGTHTAAALAAELAVDERTVRRYVEQLVELDIPVTSGRGRYGGYRLSAGERMPPLLLTEDEGLAVVLGLVAGERDGLIADGAAAREALRKLRSSLPESSARRLDALRESAAFTDAVTPAAPAETRTLLLLASAARDRRPVWFGYTTREGRTSQRTLHPFGVVAHDGRWYATGHDSLSGEVRTFRLDRIASPSLLPGTFEVPDDIDPVDTVLHSLATTPWAHEVSVVVRGMPPELRRRMRPGLATVEQASDFSPPEEWSRVRMRAQELGWVAALFAGLGRDLVIESPAELRAEVRALADRLLAATTS